MTFDKPGAFRCLAQNDVRLLAFEGTGEDLMTGRGETLMIEFSNELSEDAMQELADTMNKHLIRVYLRRI